jgi:hypothetical protein
MLKIALAGGIMRRFLLTLTIVLWCESLAAAGARVTCHANGRYRECRVGTHGNITMILELTPNACVEGVTWGTRVSGTVWVDKGCGAIFEIEEVTGAPAGGRVICESEHGNHKVCPAETRNGVTLVRKLSSAACVEEVNWGYDSDKGQIWVDDGCRAEFMIGRGSQLLSAQKLDGVVACESLGGQRVSCAADTSAGVQLIRTLSDHACRFAQEWGYDKKSIWVSGGCRAEFAVRAVKAPLQTVRCASTTGERIGCDADTEFGVAIAREFGSHDCVLDETWGFAGNNVWVAEGCSAEFALGGFRLAASAVPTAAKKLLCESVDGKRKECDVNGLRGAGLVQQKSEAACVLNRTWGYGAGGIWVDAGCRAEFAVLQ